MTVPFTPVLGDEGSSASQIPNVDDGRSATLLEKMARAMWERNREACKRVEMNLEPWEDAPEFLKVDWREIARAALQAIREPDEAVQVAGCQADDPLGGLTDWRGEGDTSRDGVARVFTAMIDSILSEGAGE